MAVRKRMRPTFAFACSQAPRLVQRLALHTAILAVRRSGKFHERFDRKRRSLFHCPAE